MLTTVYSCLFSCLPKCNCVYLCLHLFTNVYPCLFVFTYVFSCVIMITTVNSCLPMLTTICDPIIENHPYRGVFELIIWRMRGLSVLCASSSFGHPPWSPEAPWSSVSSLLWVSQCSKPATFSIVSAIYSPTAGHVLLLSSGGPVPTAFSQFLVVPRPSSVFSLTSPSRVPTIRHLPKASRRLTADKFSALLEGVVRQNDVSSWVSLLSFATNCLYSLEEGKRGGRWPPLLTNKLRMALGPLRDPSPVGAFLVNPGHCHLIISGRPCPRVWKKVTSGGPSVLLQHLMP